MFALRLNDSGKVPASIDNPEDIDAVKVWKRPENDEPWTDRKGEFTFLGVRPRRADRGVVRKQGNGRAYSCERQFGALLARVMGEIGFDLEQVCAGLA